MKEVTRSDKIARRTKGKDQGEHGNKWKDKGSERKDNNTLTNERRGHGRTEVEPET